MGISEQQRLARRHVVGSSDAAAVCGLDPHRDALAVYLEKVHDLEPEETSEAMDEGNAFEGAILEIAAKRLGVEIQRDVHAVGPETFLAANIDAVVVAPDKLVRAFEAKKSAYGHLFVQPGTDQVPDWILAQCAHYMGCLPSLELVYVPVLLARFGRTQVETFEAPRDPELVEVVREACINFWRRHVVPRVPPEPTLGLGKSALSVLRRVRRIPASVAQVDPSLALRYMEASRQAKEVDAAKDGAQAALLAAGGDAEALDFGDAKKWYTYHQYEKRTLDTDAVHAYLDKHPTLADQFRGKVPYRSLKLVNR